MDLNAYFIFFTSTIMACFAISKGQRKPKIALWPPLEAVVRGQNVKILCTLHGGCESSWVSLVRSNETRAGSAVQTTGALCSAVFGIVSRGTETYTCKYRLRGPGKQNVLQRSDPLHLNVIERPVTPSIALDGGFNTFIRGNRAKIRCYVSSKYSCSSLHLHRNGTKLRQSDVQSDANYHVANFEVQINTFEIFTCTCEIALEQRRMSSEHSDPIYTTIIDKPRKPSIFLNHSYRVFVRGELVNITCSVDFQSSSYSFYLLTSEQRRRMHFAEQKRSFATFQIQAAVPDYYMCGCGINISGQRKYSELSDKLYLTVIERPKMPEIELNESARGFLKGETVSIVCRVDVPYTVRGFYLYKIINGRSLQQIREQNGTTSVSFQVVVDETGEYRCAYRAITISRLINSEVSVSIPVTVLERPKMPEIELNESLKIFLKGESVSIVCRVDIPYTVRGFYLYKIINGHSLQQIREQNGSSSVSFQIVVNETGEYRCAYRTIMARRLIDSETSLSVSVPVLDRPLEPGISLNLNFTTVLKGELLLFTCEAPVQDSVKMFYLYKHENLLDVAPPIVMKGRQTVFNITETVNLGVEHYECMYTTVIAERLIYSKRSNPMILTIIDHVRKPTCLLEFHDYLIGEGQNVTMNCTAPIPYPSMRFIFYGISQTPIHSTQVTDDQSSAAFDVLVPRFENKSVHYSCSYQVDIGGRWIESDKCIPHRSDGIFTQLLLILGSGLLLLLLIIILICTIAIIKTGRNREGSVTSGQDTGTNTCDYAVISWDALTGTVPEDLEHTYEMVDSMDLYAGPGHRWRRDPSIYATVN